MSTSPGDRFYAFTSAVERLLTRLVIASVGLLVIVQLALYGQDNSYLTLLERFEGRQAEPVPAVAPSARHSLTLHLVNRESAPRAAVLVNGTPAATFVSGRATVAVRGRDVLEIDGSAYPEELVFRVTARSEGVVEPPLAHEVVTRGDIRMLGTVRSESASP